MYATVQDVLTYTGSSVNSEAVARAQAVVERKNCTKCGEAKPFNEFHKNKTRKDGHAEQCKVCRNSTTVRKNMTPEQRKIAQKFNTIKCVYGFTRELIEAHWMLQAGKCKICDVQMVFFDSVNRDTSFRVDHCHETGELRGLLCHHCNVALGHMRDDPERLRRAANYLEGVR